METITKTIYKSNNGKEFDTEKECLEYELVVVAGANIEHYTENFTNEMDDEEEIEKFEKKCEDFYKKDLQCLFGILITNHFDFISKL